MTVIFKDDFSGMAGLEVYVPGREPIINLVDTGATAWVDCFESSVPGIGQGSSYGYVNRSYTNPRTPLGTPLAAEVKMRWSDILNPLVYTDAPLEMVLQTGSIGGSAIPDFTIALRTSAANVGGVDGARVYLRSPENVRSSMTPLFAANATGNSDWNYIPYDTIFLPASGGVLTLKVVAEETSAKLYANGTLIGQASDVRWTWWADPMFGYFTGVNVVNVASVTISEGADGVERALFWTDRHGCVEAP